YFHHERNVVILLEPFRHSFAQNRRRERTERFPAFDFQVQDFLHVAAARIAQDGAVPERAWPPLHPALEPADDAPRGNRRGGARTEFLVISYLFNFAADRCDL